MIVLRLHKERDEKTETLNRDSVSRQHRNEQSEIPDINTAIRTIFIDELKK
jgi:hypothetical protein